MANGLNLSSQRLAPFLWLLLGGFVLRVTGQILVAFWGVTWLPPMSEWMSGLMPYPYLLPSQLVIIVVLVKVCLDFSKGSGWFVKTRPAFCGGVLYFGYIYFAGISTVRGKLRQRTVSLYRSMYYGLFSPGTI